ncbi:prolyl oligopeptidase family serine peptidase [Streptococcus mutans]|uniref:prolyl oligopeptidase family serine peptidase n=1 Tax=Streptococcus mutans TaxID=1309 RepID=UPI0004B09F67|nr:prolyl oligopeptidase family serine peptidase [Streptococcus mutans]
MGDSWYRFEDWKLPRSGIIREWKAENDDWFPKLSYTSNFNLENSRIIFNLKNLPKWLSGYQIQQISFSPEGNLLLLLVEKKWGYDFLILKKSSLVVVSTIKNVSLESSFFLCEWGLLFCRSDELGRPNQLFYKGFDGKQETLLFTEENSARRIRIIVTGGNNTSCFVRTKDFKQCSLFLYTFTKKQTKYIHLIENSFIPKLFDLVELGGKFYLFIVNNSKEDHFIYIQDLGSDTHFQIQLQLEEGQKVREINCIGNIVLLNTSTNLEYSYQLLQLKNFSPLDYVEKKIDFDYETKIYENTFSDKVMLFIQTTGFSETLLSYTFSDSKLKKVFTRPIIQKKSREKYYQRLIWADGNKDGVKVPISLIWRDDSSTGKLPKNKSCVLQVYGAYGKTDHIEPDSIVLPTVDAGFLFAIVHVRGGGFLGGGWYRDGKEMNKWNSINDLIKGVEYLVSKNIINHNHIGLIASSAGGIVAGAALNEKPKMFRSILLFSPFINPYDALQREDDPLSKMEILEWGDIGDKKVREYIKTYSPRQNVDKAKNSQTTVISLLGGKDPYINNGDVFDWSNKLESYDVNSLVYLNEKAGHGGLTIADSTLIGVLNYFFEEIEK